MSLGKRIITILNHIIPKKNIVLFSSFPPFRDNALALYRYIIQERKDISTKYDLIWAQDGVSPLIVKQYISNGRFISKNSIKGLWLFLRAKYVISTHDYFSDIRPGNGQVQINLWHGNGYKVIPKRDKVYRGDYSIGTSELYRSIIAEKLGIKEDNVWITGLPRNDDLFHKRKELKKLANCNDYSKIVFWMPTYRKAKFNHSGVDGDINVFGLNSFLRDNYDEFNNYLDQHKVLLLIKPHPMDELEDAKVVSTHNIIFITDSTIEKLHINLYSLLAETDALISDYSSVVVDYLLLDKPIGIVCADLDEYKSNRGFVLNPVVDYMPGPMIINAIELKKFIDSINNHTDIYISKRSQLKKLFHKYQDDNSSERVCNMIFGVADNTGGLD